MATLTGQKIKDTYDGLLKTTDSTQAIPATGQTTIQDGLGNNSAISLGRANNGLSVTGDIDTTGSVNINNDLQVDQTANFDGTVDFQDVVTMYDNLNVQGNADLGTLKINQQAPEINDLVTEAEGIENNDNDTSLPTSAAVIDFVANNLNWVDVVDWAGTNYPKYLIIKTTLNDGTQSQRMYLDQNKLEVSPDVYIDGQTTVRKYLTINNNTNLNRAVNSKGTLHVSTNGNIHVGYSYPPALASSNQEHNLSIGQNHSFTNDCDANIVQGNNNSVDKTNRSFVSGQDNSLTSAPACGVIGVGNIIDGGSVTEPTMRSHAVGFQNEIYGYSSQAVGGANEVRTPQNGFAAGYNNYVEGEDNCFAIGESNTVGSTGVGEGCYAIGNNLDAMDGEMSIGYRNDRTAYPATDKNNGLSEVKVAIATGAVNDHNALLITKGGVNGGSTGNIPQIARIIMPTVVGFNFANDGDAANNGIPVGGIYHHNGNLKIRVS